MPGCAAFVQRDPRALEQIHSIRTRLTAAVAAEAGGLALLDLEPLIFVEFNSSDPHLEGELARRLHLEPLGIEPDDARLSLVIPRLGTQSPFSSKASEIAQRSGLENVRRIEYGRLCRWRPQAPGPRSTGGQLAHDRMTEVILSAPELQNWQQLFARPAAAGVRWMPLLEGGAPALRAWSLELGLALSGAEIDYLVDYYRKIGRDPSDAELLLFSQVNSEHCRHKIFNSRWSFEDGAPSEGSGEEATLFSRIRRTLERLKQSPVLQLPANGEAPAAWAAYHDNAAILDRRPLSARPGPRDDAGAAAESSHILIKVETHNHPTAISPFAGAATGSGGEIRDQSATGRGGSSKAGLTGYSVSHLCLPNHPQPWEETGSKPENFASALEIALDAPLGAAAFNNEFGRPCLGGYFRSFEQGGQEPARGYHKPVMIAGGLGRIDRRHLAKKERPPPGSLLLQLGGPGMRIGIGGGAASSLNAGDNDSELDFSSVQRANPEMQRRTQEVIDRCSSSDDNPILTIHDVGAGGLGNAIAEIAAGAGGALVEMDQIPLADTSLSPAEICSNEAQERYVLAIKPQRLEEFSALCRQERCPLAQIGRLDRSGRLEFRHRAAGNSPVDIPLSLLFGELPRPRRPARRRPGKSGTLNLPDLRLEEMVERVLQAPSVADKSFLVTIGDRTVGGLSVRDPMVGPRQVAVADAAVLSADYCDNSGEAMAIGERAPAAVLDAARASRLAIAEALTNIASAPVARITDIALSANWMAACGDPEEDAALVDAVDAATEFCRELDISIPMGKDSLSMRTRWRDGEGNHREMLAPVTLVATAFAPVADVRDASTPALVDDEKTALILLDGRPEDPRLGASILSQVCLAKGGEAPDADPEFIKSLFAAVGELRRRGWLLAYHDRSDGGLIAALAEMAFAGGCGLKLDFGKLLGAQGDGSGRDALVKALFAEEPGALLQVAEEQLEAALELVRSLGLEGREFVLGRPTGDARLEIGDGDATLLTLPIDTLRRWWSSLTRDIQQLRDDRDCAAEAYEFAVSGEPLLCLKCSFDPQEETAAPAIRQKRPALAVVREQGTNGQHEMKAAFERAGFVVHDLPMSALETGDFDLQNVQGLAMAGGFSFGDTFGAGVGWAHSILYNDRIREAFQHFFARSDTFVLGVCNGCQTLAQLGSILPDGDRWSFPRFALNRSNRFEARLSLVEVLPGPSIFFADMAGSLLPIPIAHCQGRTLATEGPQAAATLRFVDAAGRPAELYPLNPNGSEGGATGFTSPCGRFNALMPHPERAFRAVQLSWLPRQAGGRGPWLRLFENARRWAEQA